MNFQIAPSWIMSGTCKKRQLGRILLRGAVPGITIAFS